MMIELKSVAPYREVRQQTPFANLLKADLELECSEDERENVLGLFGSVQKRLSPDRTIADVAVSVLAGTVFYRMIYFHLPRR